MRKIELVKKRIKDLKIQGATKLAKASISASLKYIERKKFKDFEDFYKKVKRVLKELAFLRPTEPLTQNLLGFLLAQVKKEKNLDKAKDQFLKTSQKILIILKEIKKRIGEYISNLIENKDKIFTHCHSSTVEEGLILAKEKGKDFEVFLTETRPLFQGRITAKNLLKKKIPVRMMVDSSAGFIISKPSEELTIRKIIIGADAILKDGSIVNKIGSFQIALSAFSGKVPLYVCASLLKFSPKSKIKIEKRPPQEVWKRYPQGLKIINFAFDFVPSKFISKLVCEKGLIKPKEARKTAKEIYPWLEKVSHIWQ